MEQSFFQDHSRVETQVPPKDNAIYNIHITSQKKKECENRALKVVELFLEGSIRPETLLNSVSHINSTYYQDIVEERALVKLCGYPLCGKKTKMLHKNRYSISLKNKKVYDLNECGHFCSLICYNASNFLKEQLDNSPLWLRDHTTLNEIQLMDHNAKCSMKVVDLNAKAIKTESAFTSVASFTKIFLDDCEENKCTLNETDEKNEECYNSISKLQNRKLDEKLEVLMEKIEECKGNNNTSNSNTAKSKGDKRIPKIRTKNMHSTLDVLVENDESKPDNVHIDTSKQSLEKIENCYEIETKLKAINERIKVKYDKSGVKIINPLPMKIHKECKMSMNTGMENESCLKFKDMVLKCSPKILNEVETIMKENLNKWITINTLIFIHGEQKIKDILDVKKMSGYFSKIITEHATEVQQQNYLDICKKLSIRDFLEEKCDLAFMSERTPPDVEKLKREMKELNIKVKNFYGGQFCESSDSAESDNKEEIPAVLPLVDSCSQKVLRRRVFMDALIRGVNFFLDNISYSSTSILKDLQDLVNTFKLSADNVVFKPVICIYLGLMCLKILSLRIPELKVVLNNESAIELENFVIEYLPNRNHVFLYGVKLIEDVENFLKNQFTQV